MRVGCALAGVVAACWLWAQPGFAQTGATAQADRLLVLEPLPDGVAERVGGQIGDLAWTTERGQSAPGVQAATRLAGERGARAVLWVREDTSGFDLRLFDARKRRLLERRFERVAGSGAMGRSAALESMALAVRSALRALSAEEDVGQIVGDGDGDGDGSGDGSGHVHDHDHVDEQNREDGHEHEHEHEHEHGHEQVDVDVGVDEDEHGEGDGAARLVIAGGWAAGLDGQSPVQQGPWARVGIAWGRVELGVAGELGIGADVRYQETTLRVQRADVAASAAYDLIVAARARLALAGLVGVASFARNTSKVPAGLKATPSDSTQSLALGLELRGSVQLFGGRSAALDLELGAGVLAVPAAPILRYPGASGRVDHALWLMQPDLRFGPRLRIAL